MCDSFRASDIPQKSRLAHVLAPRYERDFARTIGESSGSDARRITVRPLADAGAGPPSPSCHVRDAARCARSAERHSAFRWAEARCGGHTDGRSGMWVSPLARAAPRSARLEAYFA